MDFGKALTQIKQGKQLRRKAWGNRKFIYLVPGSQFIVNRPPLHGIFPLGTPMNYAPHIDVMDNNDVAQPWVASTEDMLAEDWEQA
ncbi:MAG: DUF2829 domain-containing protein [Nitrospiraceae bacterium]|nr:DUF2829 domain-containing protein [Nitrospiraceae bacterium]